MDEMKLSLHNGKVQADFQVNMKTNTEIQMNMQPMLMLHVSTLSKLLQYSKPKVPNHGNSNQDTEKNTNNRLQEKW